MENKNFQFKTNINCSGCVAKVTPFLNGAGGVGEWNVDTDDTNKILTVKSAGITEDEVIAIIKSKGFNAEPIAVE